MDISTFVYFLTASVLLTLAPGPDILYLLTKSLADGAKCGVFLACGLVSGIIFHTTLVIIGVAAIIQNSPSAMIALKIFGAAYLIFLSFKAFQAGKNAGEIALKKADAKVSLPKIYARGVLMNVLNPKVLLFFLAFLPQFVNLSEENVGLQIAFLGFVFAMQALLIFSAISVCAGKVRKFLTGKKNIGKFFAFTESGVLALIAVSLMFL